MSEHEWKFGDWGRDKHGGYIVRFVTEAKGCATWWLFRNGQMGCNREVEHQPDCTGWDWQPPKPIEPPPGYRLMEPKELINNGDKFLGSLSIWTETNRCSGVITVGEVLRRYPNVKAYARKIETPKPIEPPPGYRYLIDGEVIGGDDLALTMDWMPVQRFTIGMEYGSRLFVPMARKIEPTYRAFANAEEYKPFRERWVIPKQPDGKFSVTKRASDYSDLGLTFASEEESLRSFEECFNWLLFEDGTPFGIKVEERAK